MKKDWFKRFEAAIRNSGRSLRDISLAADARPGYLHDVFKKEQDPGVTRFLAVCDAAGVSPIEILTGVQSSPKIEKIEKLFSALSPDQQNAFLELFEKLHKKQ